MKKQLLAMILALTLLFSVPALAVDYVIPDPEHFFGQSMEETREYNYVMYFDEDPRDMYDAYMALLLNNYNMYDLEIVPTAHIFSKVGVENQGMTIQYDVDDEGYRITFSIPPLLQLEKREQYDQKWADAQEHSSIVLPDPGYYFDKFYAAGTISFDEYPKAEFDAYTALLIGQYGLEVTEEYHGENKEYFHMTVPGVDNARVYVSCFYDSNRHYWTGSGNAMDIEFSGNITLSDLDIYEHRAENLAVSEVAWDDGRMIADPGDFLGYEIKVTNICDMTFFDYGGNYFERDYEEIDADDIQKYIDALENSPYFEICGTYSAKYASYKQIYFEYVGPDAEVAASCKEGRRGSDRECDLYIQIHYRDQDRSTFRIVTFPEFTVNSEDYVEPQPTPDDPSIFETCNVCYGNGDCNYCWGRGYHWNDRNQDCSVCRGTGNCYSCGGSGRK